MEKKPQETHCRPNSLLRAAVFFKQTGVNRAFVATIYSGAD